jgi:ATP-binding cassette subfamily C protein LapB
MIIGVGTALILETILKGCRSAVSSWSDARYEYFSLSKGVKQLLYSNLNDFEKSSPGVYLEKLNAIYSLKNFFGGQALLVIVDIPFAVLYLAVIAYLAGPLVLIPIVMLILFAWSILVTSKTMSDEIEERYQVDDRRINYVISLLTGVHTVKSMAIENPMLRRYERLQEASSNSSYQVGLSGSIASIISNSAMQITTALVVAIGAYWVINGHMSSGGLAACILLAGRALQPIGRAIEVLTRLQSIKLAENRLEELNKMPQEKSISLPTFPHIDGKIEIKGLSFRYHTNMPWIFKDINLSIPAKETIAIEGSNFSGKTTLLWMILNIYYPTQGHILIDGHDSADYNATSMREMIAYLPQRGVLFNGTLLENLTMFRPELADKAKAIAEEWGIASDIRKLAFGYETRIGKAVSEAISPGLRELIAIARAFVQEKEPRIILFDEATRYLDVESDNILQKALKQYKGRSTMVIISSRPSMLSMADRRYAMADMALREVS